MKFSPRTLLLALVASLVASQCLAADLKINTTTVPNGTAHTSYSTVIQASGGCVPYKWTLASGKLPTGLSASASSSTRSLSLAGTPTTAGTYSFAEKVTGCKGGTAQASYKIVVQTTANHVVNLKWKASTSDNIAGYNVYRSTDSTNWKKINVSLIASTLYSDSTVANSTTYYYEAAAVDISGQESPKTPPVKSVIP